MPFDIDGLLDLWTTPYADEAAPLAAFGAWYADPVVVNGTSMMLSPVSDA